MHKEHKGVICNLTSASNSSQSTCPTGRVLWEELLAFLDFTRNYERTSGILSPENRKRKLLEILEHLLFISITWIICLFQGLC